MAEHAEVFISGTTRDLGSYRRVIKDALLTLQIFPIEETLAYGPLKAMLDELIGRCDAVIHLAGSYFGAEPPQRPPASRAAPILNGSTMWRGNSGNLFTYFLPPKAARSMSVRCRGEEEDALQRAHRRAIEQCGNI